MKKNALRCGIAALLLLILYNVLAFLIPFARTAPFWLAYGFTTFAIVMQLPLLFSAFHDGKQAQSWLYGFPIVRVGGIYLAVQLIIGFVAMAISGWIPLWVLIVVEALLFGGAAMGLLTTGAMRDEIKNQDAKLQKDTSTMRELQSRACAMLEQATDSRLCAALRAFADNLRYSDPVSSDMTREAENNLLVCIDDMERALVDGDAACAVELCRKAEAALTERNRLCKLNK